MEQKSILKSLLYVALFISLFVLIQAIFQLPAVGIYAYLKGLDFTSVFEGFKQGKYSDVIIISDLFSSLFIILLFIKKGGRLSLEVIFIQNLGRHYFG